MVIKGVACQKTNDYIHLELQMTGILDNQINDNKRTSIKEVIEVLKMQVAYNGVTIQGT